MTGGRPSRCTCIHTRPPSLFIVILTTIELDDNNVFEIRTGRGRESLIEEIITEKKIPSALL